MGNKITDRHEGAFQAEKATVLAFHCKHAATTVIAKPQTRGRS